MIRDFLRDGDRLVSALLIERNQWILLSLPRSMRFLVFSFDFDFRLLPMGFTKIDRILGS